MAGGITAAVALSTRPDGMTIKAIGSTVQGTDLTPRRPKDYKNSRLFLHKNGTFAMKIIYLDVTELVAVGGWVKNGKKYVFTYVDLFEVIGDTMKRNTTTLREKPEWTFEMQGGRIAFCDHNFRYFYFK
jgi:hypothetical protein